jgi:hypothetical protein
MRIMKKENIKTFIIAILLIFIWFDGCKENKPIPTKGTFKTDTIVKHIPIKGETKIVKGKEVIVYKNNEINKELAEENYNLQIAYINAKDSLEKEKLYKNAIELKSFSNDFENDNFKANVSGIVQGEVKSLQLDYEIKKVPTKETKFRMLLGVGVALKAVDLNVGFQNAKGNLLEIGYDTEKNIRIGYKQSIFSIKKP